MFLNWNNTGMAGDSGTTTTGEGIVAKSKVCKEGKMN
jgi:hypothetical protein